MENNQKPESILTNFPNNIGPVIKEMRQRLGISQSDLAAILCSDARTIRKWERGYSRPNRVYIKLMTMIPGIKKVFIEMGEMK